MENSRQQVRVCGVQGSQQDQEDVEPPHGDHDHGQEMSGQQHIADDSQPCACIRQSDVQTSQDSFSGVLVVSMPMVTKWAVSSLLQMTAGLPGFQYQMLAAVQHH